MNHSEPAGVREAVGVFESEKDLQAAIDDLLSHGFDRAELSLLAPMQTVKDTLGRTFRSVTELEDDAQVPVVAFTSKDAVSESQGAIFGSFFYVGALAALVPVVVSGGALAAALIAVGLGGGTAGAIGAILARIIGQRHAATIEQQLERGGLLLWVRTWNQNDEARAMKILSAHSGVDVHVHGLADTSLVLEGRYAGKETRNYRAHNYIVIGDNAYYVFGKVFATEYDAKADIDRHSYLETLRSDAIKNGLDLDAAMLDPEREFQTPDSLMATDLPNAIKLELLKRWAYEASELARATGEGMPACDQTNQLQKINLAIEELS